MEIFSGAGEKEASAQNWREVVDWTENAKDASLFRVFATSAMDINIDSISTLDHRRARRLLYVMNRISATQAVTCSHPGIVEHVASGNGTGRCAMWAPAEPDDDAEVEWPVLRASRFLCFWSSPCWVVYRLVS
jgi:hypothetical protein